ncbi:S41 family peptidase [Mucilaginibacter defluvii]|uniref:S41 family peptidase n=1 Tax=Mucilaginibacter defluvii TaxID=1196019 RepID=A0ABP9FUS1_9SPHI
MKKYIYAAAFSVAILATACKKEKNTDTGGDDKNTPPTTGSTIDKVKDSVLLYAQEDYLWNDQLPTYDNFKPRSFTGSNDLEALQNEVDALSQYAKNPSTNRAFEYNPSNPGTSKYSFIDDGTTSGELGGQASGDFGFEPRYGADGGLYIKYVYANSPAGNAGVKRGYKVTRINNRTSWNPQSNSDIQFIVSSFYSSNNIKLGLQKPDGSTINIDINAASYTINPVLAYKVFTVGNKKIGYMVFNTFTSPANAQPKIDQAFTLFNSENVTDLIVDFRYNGGGYVATADYLCNLIVPAAKNNQVMYTYYFNKGLQDNKYTLINKSVFDNKLTAGSFKPENNQEKFSKKGSLNLGKVVFIVSGSSASASELTINTLLPHMDVKIVGETSYGKPVGFFAIPINKYELYIPEFETRNSAGKADYYAGMVPGSTNFPGVEADDDVAHDFGDADEQCTQRAISYITTGNYLSLAKQQTKRVNAVRMLSVDQTRDLGLKLERPHFKGMVAERLK